MEKLSPLSTSARRLWGILMIFHQISPGPPTLPAARLLLIFSRPTFGPVGAKTTACAHPAGMDLPIGGVESVVRPGCEPGTLLARDGPALGVATFREAFGHAIGAARMSIRRLVPPLALMLLVGPRASAQG